MAQNTGGERLVAYSISDGDFSNDAKRGRGFLVKSVAAPRLAFEQCGFLFQLAEAWTASTTRRR
jgi:hypothetical protein